MLTISFSYFPLLSSTILGRAAFHPVAETLGYSAGGDKRYVDRLKSELLQFSLAQIARQRDDLTALHLLPPRQRVILLLSDVLDWRASEVAHLLEISLGAVNSALHRARVTLEKHYDTNVREKTQVSCTDAETSILLSRYVQAWETDDVAGLVALLKEEATLSMPPFPSWYCGRDAIHAILTAYPFRFGEHGLWRLYPTVANGQPAFAFYRANESKDAYLAFGIQVVTLGSSPLARYVAGVTMFHGPSLVAFFGLPLQLPASSNT